MDIQIYGQGLRVEGGPYALFVYRKEFGEDLFKDLEASIGEGSPQLSIWLQIIWAMNRTADETAAPYGEWLRSFPLFDLTDMEAVEVMDGAITAGFFRPGREGAGRIRKAAARRLRAMAGSLRRKADGLELR